MRHRFLLLLGALLAALGLAHCSSLTFSSSGDGQAPPPRVVRDADVAVPPGYRIEAVATGLTFPIAAVLDARDHLHVVEAGSAEGDAIAAPRLVRIEPDGTAREIARGANPPWTGASFHDGSFYISEGGVPGRILRFDADGRIRAIVDGLPPRADHFTDRPVPGPDGWIYFGQGTATNSGIVGEDNLERGWLRRLPEAHDIACADLALAGRNFRTPDFRDGSEAAVRTGAYVPFGTPTRPGQRIAGRVPCTGAVMRVLPDGGPVELVAWGLRHPHGLAFSPDGVLYATERGYEARGSRPIRGAGDHLWRIEPGRWYGWPDYAGGEPVDAERFRAPDRPPAEPLLAAAPQRPPRPVAELGVRSGSSGLDFSTSERFGHRGSAFVAQSGDLEASSGAELRPAGFRVVRIDPATGAIEPFAANRGGAAPASRLQSGGLERPIDVRFSRAGSVLYVVDSGVIARSERGPEPRAGTGVVWRITREPPDASASARR